MKWRGEEKRWEGKERGRSDGSVFGGEEGTEGPGRAERGRQPGEASGSTGSIVLQEEDDGCFFSFFTRPYGGVGLVAGCYDFWPRKSEEKEKGARLKVKNLEKRFGCRKKIEI
jgi:hypothetical protein